LAASGGDGDDIRHMLYFGHLLEGLALPTKERCQGS